MNPIIKKNGINYGIGLGVLSVLIGTITYALNLYGAWWLGILSILISMVIYIFVVFNTKKQLNGQISFKEAFTVFFISAVVSVAIGLVFTVLLYNVIDPGAKETIKEESIKVAVSMMEKFNAPASEINKAIEKMEKEDNFSVGSLMMGSVVNLAVASVYGLLLALIFKSSPKYQE